MRNKKIRIVAVLAMVAAMLGAIALAGGEWVNAGKEKKIEWSEQDFQSRELLLIGKKIKKHDAKEFSTAADLPGLDKAELKEKLINGEKLYDLLVESGALDEYKQMLLDTKKEKLYKLVQIGEKTQEEADARFEEFKTEVENWDGTTDIIGKWFKKAY